MGEKEQDCAVEQQQPKDKALIEETVTVWVQGEPLRVRDVRRRYVTLNEWERIKGT